MKYYILLICCILLSCTPPSVKDYINSLDDVTIVLEDTLQPFQSSFLLEIKQPLDHKNLDKGFFKQRFYLNHKNINKPVVFIHAGYSLRKNKAHELSTVLDANQIKVEYRFYGTSKPDSVLWEYLNSEQGLADHHKIVSLFKPLYHGKWIATGYSKGGASALSHYRHYTSDFDVVIPYDAPITFGKEDPRTTEFIYSVGSKEKRDSVLLFQQTCLKRSTELLPFFKEEANVYKTDFTWISAEEAFEYAVLEYSFTYWQRGHYTNSIPSPNAPAKELANHLLATSGAWFYTDAGINTYLPSYYQHATELGYYGFPTKGLTHLLKHVKAPHNDVFSPKNVDLTFKPGFVQDVSDWLETKGNNIIYLFGEYDPWAANYVDLSKNHTNSVRHIWDKGYHATKIKHLRAEQKADIASRLSNWLQMDITL